MDNIAYLNQISSTHTKKNHLHFFVDNKKLKIIGIVLVSLTLLITLIAILTNLPPQENDFLPRLSFRVNHVNNLIKTYKKNIKSSNLRASSSSLSGILDDMNNNLSSYFTKDASNTPDFVAKEELETYNTAIQALEKGHINGQFDHAYAREMTFYTSILIALMEDIEKNAKTESTKSYITQKKIGTRNSRPPLL